MQKHIGMQKVMWRLSKGSSGSNWIVAIVVAAVNPIVEPSRGSTIVAD